MSAAVWLWSFVRPITPAQARAAVKAGGLGEDWVPVVPFPEVATRAVGDIKAQRTSRPGLIIWEARGKTWFADLTAEEMVFESPRSKAAKEITARLGPARDLQPRDMNAYLEAAVRDWGAVHLMGPLWLVPDAEGAETVLSMLRSLPGASVAALPIEGAAVAGEVLALLASRVQAESERLLAGVEGLKAATARARAGVLRERAEGVARLAGIFGIDLSELGVPLVTAESRLMDMVPGSHYAAPLAFGGVVGAHRKPEPIRAVVPKSEPVGDRPIQTPYRPDTDPIQPEHITDTSPPPMLPHIEALPMEGTYRKPGDPHPGPALGMRAVKTKEPG